MRRTMLALLLLLLHNAPPVRAGLFGYSESFTGADGSTWPAPWFAGGAHVTVADLQGGRGRLNGDPGFVARMILPGFDEQDVEVFVTFEFEDVAHQGIGFYVRQNGGTLREYLPHGQGYAMFLKGAWAWPEDLGLWREIDGVETQFANGYDPLAGGLQDGVPYRLRFRVYQLSPAMTSLQAKVWPEAEAEPESWTIEATDAQPLLQAVSGDFALDIYNQSGSGHVFVDDLEIRPYPDLLPAPEAWRASGVALGAPTPNPARGTATARLTLPRPARVTAALLDIVGRRVATVADGPLPAGEHVLDLAAALGGLAPGVYRLAAEVGGVRLERRVVRVR